MFGKTHREYTGQERLQMAQDAIQFGLGKTSQKYGVSSGTIKVWRKYLIKFGEQKLLGMKTRVKKGERMFNYKRPTDMRLRTSVGVGDDLNTRESREFQLTTNAPLTSPYGLKGIEGSIDPMPDQSSTTKVELIDKNMDQSSQIYINTKENVVDDAIVPPSRPQIPSKRYKVDVNILEKIAEDANNAPNDNLTDIYKEFPTFIYSLEKYKLEMYESILFLTEINIELRFIQENLVSFKFDEEIYKHNINNIEEIEREEIRIYIGFTNSGIILTPVFILDNKNINNSQYLDIIKERMQGECIIYSKIENINYDKLCLDWLRRYIGDIQHKGLIIHSLSELTKFQLPGSESVIDSNSKIHYMNIPPDICKRVFYFHLFILPALRTNILTNYFGMGEYNKYNKYIYGGEQGRDLLLIGCVLKALRELNLSSLLACFSAFISNAINYRICKLLPLNNSYKGGKRVNGGSKVNNKGVKIRQKVTGCGSGLLLEKGAEFDFSSNLFSIPEE